MAALGFDSAHRMTVTGAGSDANDSKAYWIQMTALRFPESYGGQPETPLD
jgi:hypothetical protein